MKKALQICQAFIIPTSDSNLRAFNFDQDNVKLETLPLKNMQFRFSGLYNKYIHPESGVHYLLLDGTIIELEKNKVLRKEKIVFIATAINQNIDE